MLSRTIILRLADRPRVRSWFSRSRLTQSLIRRFIAGEDVSEAIAVARDLEANGFEVSLDHLGENVRDAAEARRALEDYIHLVDEIGRAGIDSTISIKLTQLGLDVDQTLCQDQLLGLIEAATERNIFVWIDMESSDYTDRTLDLFESAYAQSRQVGTVLQAYLYRTSEDLDRLLGLGARIRLVKGAYLEPATVAYRRKSEVDENYVALMHRLIEQGNLPAIATHDPKLIASAKAQLEALKRDKRSIEFQMLYGISRETQTKLVSEGYRTLIYVPYGDQWYPYFVRRLAERPANLYFVLKNLLRR